MSNPSIKQNGTTFTFQDGNCARVTVQKQGQLDETPIPASDSDATFVIDINGVIKTIMLSGVITDASLSVTDNGVTTMTIEQQMAWLLNLVQGAQTGYKFNSTYQTNKTVYCRRVTFDENAGDPLRVSYTIELVEGS